MATSEMQVRFRGPAVDDGTMDVRDLAPALLALGDLFREANRVAEPNAPDVGLHIKATSVGSFQIDMDLVATVGIVFASDPATALANLKALVIDPLTGLVGLLRRRHADESEVLRNASNLNVVTFTNENTTLEFPAAVLQMGQSFAVRQSFTDATKPLEREGIDEIVFSIGPSIPPVVLTPTDLPAIQAPIPGDDRVILDATNTVVLQVKTPQLDVSEGNLWRFSTGTGGGGPISARVTDEKFLEKIASRKEGFLAGDILVCRLRTVQKITPKGKLRTSNEVVEVIDHHPPERYSQDELGV